MRRIWSAFTESARARRPSCQEGAGNARAGQALRGSSEFHAWGDSNLYLRRDGDDLMLTVEHLRYGHAFSVNRDHCAAFA
jgi:hypothetical protein